MSRYVFELNYLGLCLLGMPGHAIVGGVILIGTATVFTVKNWRKQLTARRAVA